MNGDVQLVDSFIRLLSKPPESELLLGDTEQRSGVYSDVHEHSSTGSTQEETDCGGLVERSISGIRSESLIIALPSTFILYAHSAGANFQIAAQDCSVYSGFGAYTGELSADMLLGAGVKYVILGHSERRSRFDSVPTIYEKLVNVVRLNMMAILCVSEDYESQIDTYTEMLIRDHLNNIVLAYEPVSAIGTGHVPHPHEIQQTVVRLQRQYGNPRIVYGGSVTSANAGQILGIDEIAGLLIGGASLNLNEVVTILKLL
jgi:triosephosphate isomerase